MSTTLDFLSLSQSDPNGRYMFEGLPAGDYFIKASGGTGYIKEFYRSASNFYTATLVSIEGDLEEAGDIDLQLDMGQSISGGIWDEETGQPVSGFAVYAIEEGSLPYGHPQFYGDPIFLKKVKGLINPFGEPVEAITDTNGSYEIKGLAPGRYYVFTGNTGKGNTDFYIPEHFENSPFCRLATLIPISGTAGADQIDICLMKGGGISGIVSDPNGVGIEGTLVTAQDYTSWIYGIEGSGLPAEAITDPNGRYWIIGLPPGSYHVLPYSKGMISSPDQESLVVGVIKGGETTGCNFVLNLSKGRITGSVISLSGGSPLKGISVVCQSYSYPYTFGYYGYPYIYSYGYSYGYYPAVYGYYSGQALTDTSGVYSITNIDIGQYIVKTIYLPFLRGDLNRFTGQVYRISDREVPLNILDSEEISGVDFYLETGGSISGRVLNRIDRSPIQGVMVRAYKAAVSYYQYYPYYSGTGNENLFAFTDSEGVYRIGGLDQGIYKVYIAENNMYQGYSYSTSPYPFPRSGEYIDPLADNTYTYYSYSYDTVFKDPWRVWVNPPEDTSGVDFELMCAGSISGVVRSARTGEPIPSVEITAFKIYRPSDSSDGYVTNAGAYYSGYSYAYPPYGGPYGYGYYGGLYGGNYGYPSTVTDMNGFYTIKGLYAGEYQLYAFDRKGVYSPSDFSVVELQVGQALTDQDFSLQLLDSNTGSISGVITDQTDGSPIPDMLVTAQWFVGPDTDLPYSEPNDNSGTFYGSYNSWMDFPYLPAPYSGLYPAYGYYGGYYPYMGYGGYGNYGFSVTDENGEYLIKGLGPGEYMVTCDSPYVGYMRECYVEAQGVNLTELHSDHLIRIEKDLTCHEEIRPILQIRYQAIHTLNMDLMLRDKNGMDMPMLMKLGAYGVNSCEGLFLGPEWCFDSHDYDIDVDRGSWAVMEIDIEELLYDYFSSSSCFPGQHRQSEGLDSLIKIGFEGNGFKIDYIRLKGTDTAYIEGFNYLDSPTAHGWQVTSSLPLSQNITMLSGDYLEGGGGMRVLAETPVLVSPDTQTKGIDMALSKGGEISGMVRDSSESNPVPGAMIQLRRIDRDPVSYYSGSDYYYASSDKNGNYSIKGVRPGVYSLLITDDNKGIYQKQWYEHVHPQPEFHYDSGYYDYGFSDYMPVFSIGKSGLTGFTHPVLEFLAITSDLFSLSLDVVTTMGNKVKIKFHNSKNEYFLGTILVRLDPRNQSSRMWRVYRYDLDEILREYLSAHLDHVEGIMLKGRYCFIDYIKLTKEGEEDQVIDDFYYGDSPLDHGWTSDSSIGFAPIQDPLIGHSCRILSPAKLLTIDEGANLAGKDFTLRPYGVISGNVYDWEDSSPVQGIRLSVLAKDGDLNDTFYGYYLPSFSGRDGSYFIKGLLPGEYRVLAYDPKVYFMAQLYRDISLNREDTVNYSSMYTPYSANHSYPAGSIALISRDLTQENITNPVLHLDAKYEDSFGFTLKVDTTDGSAVELNFQTDAMDNTNNTDNSCWWHDWDEDTNTLILFIRLTCDSVYNPHYIGPDMWQSLESDLDHILEQEFSKDLKKIKDMSIWGNSFSIASIRFTSENGPDEVVDDFDYSDPPVNHGWVIQRPTTTYPRMVIDTVIEKRVLTCSAAAPVTVEEGVMTQGIDFRLVRGNVVTGRITDAFDGSPIPGIYVFADRTQGDYAGYTYEYYYYSSTSAYAYTDKDGRYTLLIEGFSKPGSFWIKAQDGVWNSYIKTSYPSPLELTSGMEFTNIDFAMEQGGSISGRVTFFDSDIPAQDAFVECRGYFNTPYALGSRTDSDGYYKITGIPEGGYVIYARSQDCIFEGFYQDTPDYLDPPFVESGVETKGMDIHLYPKKEEESYSVPNQGQYYSGTQGSYGSYSSIYASQGLYGSIPYQAALSYTQQTAQAGPGYTQQAAQAGPVVITSRPDLVANVEIPYTYRVTIQDPNRRRDLECSLIEGPSGMEMDEDAWLIDWTPTLEQVGDHMVRVGVNASDGSVARQAFAIHVFPYMVIESADGEESPLLKGEWGIFQGTGSFSDTNDSELKSMILFTQTAEGDPLNFGIQYPVGASLENPRPYLCFAVKGDKEFRFCVGVKAGGTGYILQYAPSDGNCIVSGNIVHHPIGSEYKDGHWHLCKRDLEKDLEGTGMSFEEVTHFQIWGECRIDDIWLSYRPIDYQIFLIKIFQGLNLISLPIKFDTMSSKELNKLLKADSSSDLNLRRRNAFLSRWEGNFDVVRDDQGFIIYSTNERWITLKGTQKKLDLSSLASLLKRGINLVSSPTDAEKPDYATAFLRGFRETNKGVRSLQMYDRSRGGWHSKYCFFGRFSGPDFDIQHGKGYVVYLVKD